ncbi:MAG: phosphodiester glycosidase family protein [Bdellovibrionales bacterium]|nr:phosphodiester glycosidase family protein [Bdellovibrionales bacterium]
MAFVWLTSSTLLAFLISVSASYAQTNGVDSATAEATHWTKIGKGLEIGVAELSGGLLPGEITLVKTSLKHMNPQVVRASSFGKHRANTEWFAKKTGASLCVNANFFDKSGDPLGLVISRGVEHKPVQLGGSLLTGLFLVYRDSLVIAGRDEKRTELGLEAVQAGPRLIINGVPKLKDLDGKAQSRRSGVCLVSGTEYVIFVAASALRGPTLQELAHSLSLPSVGCREALNFDGGGSTQLYIPEDIAGAASGFGGINIVGRDDVPTALCLFPST